MNSFEMVSNAIAKKLEIDVTTIKPESTLEELGLDSLDTFDIIFEAEDKLGIKVPNDQVDVKTIQDMTNLLDQLLAKKV
ncbi:acyl carrier protein [Candidatus Methylopumilus universalis]|jgi:acyl carrier protein|uniref:Acyl carrier protein n=1 Tax=Candidatus Methylopumilus universalis TaxID=2588536 RepID=A0AAX1F0S1_9PROT|nr:phosphopantetheine-binding protein [Candidatus Methylopumilus universalis]QDC41664.1 acyl carrier protein [Candidatus Methylopumilus universalis]QDC42945.1 acyl carrier protein [Candidatus Methylopumilus universalis]QDC55334.1 acyl carrier protein [Candidatus Methylopumilus universalis]QDC56613.1 acyl carrier protein [Candidatus Methylopumilus universalis]QDC57904.1 acyl carrier protein [Candidatus Methylopumilus universalis]